MDQNDKQFLACVVQVKSRTKKTPVTACFVPNVCVLFSVANLFKEWVPVFISVAIRHCFTR